MVIIRWLKWKLGKSDHCTYIHPNETHWSWFKRTHRDEIERYRQIQLDKKARNDLSPAQTAPSKFGPPKITH